MNTENALTVQEEGKRQKPALVAGGGLSAIVPQNVEQAFRMAQLIVASGIAPRDMKTPEAVVTSIMAGMEVGLPPMQAVQSIAVVNGRPTIWGDAALGLVMASDLCEDFQEHVEGSGDNMVAVCTAKRRGMDSPSVQRFSVQDAKNAGLWGKQGPWKQYPQRMLAMRARAFALRNLFPDVLKGLGVREEVRDFSGPAIERTVRPEPTGTAAALAQQAVSTDEDETVDVQAETIDDEPAADEPDEGTDDDTAIADDADMWIERINAGLTKQVVEQTYATWMKERFATAPEDERKAVTRAKNRRIFDLDAQDSAQS